MMARDNYSLVDYRNPASEKNITGIVFSKSEWLGFAVARLVLAIIVASGSY